MVHSSWLQPRRIGNIASVEALGLTRHLLARPDAGALEGSRYRVPILAAAQSVSATLRALKLWAFSPVTMQML